MEENKLPKMNEPLSYWVLEPCLKPWTKKQLENYDQDELERIAIMTADGRMADSFAEMEIKLCGKPRK